MLRIGSLFSGAGGLDMAVETVFGGTTVWHSEIDKAASKVLAHRWPDVPNLGDITKANWNAAQPVDVICGGFPCQDVSTAGRRAGLADGTRSGLWAEMARIIGLLSPTWVVIENVKGLLSAQAHRNLEPGNPAMGDGSSRPVLRAIGAVLGDLSELGYDAEWVTVAASSIGAPHRRQRVFLLAHAPSQGRPRNISQAEPRRSGWCGDEPELLTTPQARDHKGTNSNSGGPWQSLPRDIGNLLPTPSASDGDPGGGPNNPENRLAQGHHVQLIDLGMRPDLWGKYAEAIHRWETVTRPAPPATEPNKVNKPRLAAPFSEWMMGWPAGWVTNPEIGLSRIDQLRICGNGVVPQQAAAALQHLIEVAAQ